MHYGPFIALLAMISTRAQAETQTNVALNKDTVQSVTYTSDHPASFAVDGDTGTCSETYTDPYPYWLVNLGDLYLIDFVRLIGTRPQTINFTIALSLDDDTYTSMCEHYGPISSTYTCTPRYRDIARWIKACSDPTRSLEDWAPYCRQYPC